MKYLFFAKPYGIYDLKQKCKTSISISAYVQLKLLIESNWENVHFTITFVSRTHCFLICNDMWIFDLLYFLIVAVGFGLPIIFRDMTYYFTHV
jgi:hypothetical protein